MGNPMSQSLHRMIYSHKVSCGRTRFPEPLWSPPCHWKRVRGNRQVPGWTVKGTALLPEPGDPGSVPGGGAVVIPDSGCCCCNSPGLLLSVKGRSSTASRVRLWSFPPRRLWSVGTVMFLHFLQET